MKVRFKVWLEVDGKPVLSEGKYKLLKEVERTGSIMAAAKSLGLTYKRAHSQIKSVENRIGKRIVERKRKRGALLTEEGIKLLKEYERVYERLRECMEDLLHE